MYSVKYFGHLAITAMKSSPNPMSTMRTTKVELRSVELLHDGESLVLGLVATDQQMHRIEMPSWTVHQLMRLLPRLDASLLQSAAAVADDLIAYPVVEWCVLPAGAGREVALSLKNGQQIESAYLFAADDARAIHAALGEAIDAGSISARSIPPVQPHPPCTQSKRSLRRGGRGR
jgi:hypothetical protein